MTEGKIYQHISIKKLPDSELEIEGELIPESLSPFYEKALLAIKAKTELPGFRRGHVPEKVIKERVGELFILEDAAELALQAAYPEIVREHDIHPISYPQVAITSIAVGAPVKFKATVPVFPEFVLPAYKKIADDISKPIAEEVSDTEVEKAIEQARKEHRHHEFHENSEDKSHDGPNHPQESEVLGELTDEEAKKLGKVSSASELRTKVKEMLTEEKKRTSLEKRRVGILDALVAETELAVPKVAVESELSRMEQEFAGDLSRLNLNLEEYLKRTNKTKESLYEDWRPRAVSRTKLELILSKIAETEKLSPASEDIEKEIAHLKEHHPQADTNSLRSYIIRILTHQKVLEFLEK